MSEGDTSNNKRKPDYTQGKKYIIRNAQNNLAYWKHLPNTGQRMIQHRVYTRKHQHYKLYQALMNLEDMPFTLNFLKTTRARKEKNEGEKIREHQRELNTIVSGRTKQEYRQDKFQQIQNKQKEIFERNRSKLIKYQKDY